MNSRYELSKLQKNSMETIFPTGENNLSTVKGIAAAAVYVVRRCVMTAPAVFPVQHKNSFIAYALAYGLKKAMIEGYMSVKQGLRVYVLVKKAVAEKNGDTGYFGDILEVLIRCALVGNIDLIRPDMIHVKGQSKIDIVSRRFGKVEVGHNGKTWSNATIFDYMSGDFTSVIYGVFEQKDKDSIISLIRNNEIVKALKYACSYCGYWSDKYNFFNDIESLSSGKGLTIKTGKVMSQYNDSKQKVFIKALEDGKFTCLADLLNIK